MKKSIDLYSESDLKTMKATAEIASHTKNRIEQIIEYLKKFDYKTIGVANCIAFQKQNEKLCRILEDKGFDVIDVNCREGILNKGEYTDDKQGSSCNPAYQAQIMKDNNVDFVIILGLCLGHDIVFQGHCKIPYTHLVIKDFTNEHKTIELLK